MVKLVLVVAVIVSLGAVLGVAGYLTSKPKTNPPVVIMPPSVDKEVAIATGKTEIFVASCHNDCSWETKLLILSTAQKTLEVFQKEFSWMMETALKPYYVIEVNPLGVTGRSYVDYKTRTVKLTRIYVPTIAHEISHLLIAESFGLEEEKNPSESIYPKGPTWLHEGLAMYLEYRVDDSRRAGDVSLLKSTSQFLNKEQLMQGDVGESLKLFYSQSWSLTEFLIKKGSKERLQLMIEEIRKHPRREQICREWHTPPDSPKICIYSEAVISAFWEEYFDKIYQDITPNWDSFYQEWMEYARKNY